MALRPCYGRLLLRSVRAARLASPTTTCTMYILPTPHIVPLRDPLRPDTNLLLLHCKRYTIKEPSSDSQQQQSVAPKSTSERVRALVREYGTVGFVFYMGVSLTSLGTCYILVSNGLDVQRVLTYLNVSASTSAKGASTFAIAYLLHKVFLPLRAAITIGGLPLVVRQLRSMGWMKPKS